MRVHVLQHVPFEGLGSVDPWLMRRSAERAVTHPYRGEPLPAVGSFDWLIVLGGPMSVHDVERHPWLVAEKALITAAVDAGRTVLGICLGAQLLAEALGGDVAPGAYREIGWFPVRRSVEASAGPLAGVLPATFDAFHWHGDAFTLPPGATPLGSSDACAIQGFLFGDRVLGWQCHLEAPPEGVRALVAHCADELDGSLYVQSPERMLADTGRYARCNRLMDGVLDVLAAA